MKSSNVTKTINTIVNNPWNIGEHEWSLYGYLGLIRRTLRAKNLTNKTISAYEIAVFDFDMIRGMIRCDWNQVIAEDVFIFYKILRRSGLTQRGATEKIKRLIFCLELIGNNIDIKEVQKLMNE